MGRERMIMVAVALSLMASVGQPLAQAGQGPLIGRIFAWGDSLTRGVGASDISKSFPSLLAQAYPNFEVLERGVGGQKSSDILQRMTAAEFSDSDVVLIWAGRNNFDDTKGVLADIAKMVGRVTSGRFLVGSVINGDSAAEQIGGARYERLVTLNDRLAEIYGDRFVDLRGPLVASGDPVRDITFIAGDTVPDTLRADGIHLNDLGYAIVASTWRAAIDAHGWAGSDQVLASE